ncbi:MAG: LysR substrate-binding domain-containing protein [Planctomycetota bacterium]
MKRATRPRPTLRQLEYLIAVAETLNFRAAAAASHVSQPALSEQIRLLEEQLGVRLLERNRRRVALTTAGVHVLERARAVIGDVDTLVEAAVGQGGPLVGPLSFGAIPTVAPYVLPGLLTAARAAHPKLRLVLREARTSELLELLRTGRLDAALLALPIPAPGLTSLPLCDDPFLLVAPAGHRLAGSGPARLSELRRSEVLLLEDGHCLRDQALALCHENGARELGDASATSLRTLLGLVGAGLGVTLLPAMARAEAECLKGLVVRSFKEPAPKRRIGLVWRSTSSRSVEFLMLGEIFRVAFPAGALSREAP